MNLNLPDLSAAIYGGGPIAAVSAVITFILGIIGLIAFFYVLYGGFQYLTAGGDDKRAADARKFIVNAIIGIIIVFLSLAIVKFVTNSVRQAANDQTDPAAYLQDKTPE